MTFENRIRNPGDQGENSKGTRILRVYSTLGPRHGKGGTFEEEKEYDELG